ncbi:hypothetical protein ACH5RR_040559 [Cinchona calisaya]|uniref:Uncharacterized protein n=1 Tax=Cinchona calisaya TaxID=153742 RepID=A0ABD2XU76_9GENT
MEDIEKPEIDEELQLVAMKYKDTYKCQNKFTPLVKLEDKYGNMMKKSQSKDNVPIHEDFCLHKKHEPSQKEDFASIAASIAVKDIHLGTTKVTNSMGNASKLKASRQVADTSPNYKIKDG